MKGFTLVNNVSFDDIKNIPKYNNNIINNYNKNNVICSDNSLDIYESEMGVVYGVRS